MKRQILQTAVTALVLTACFVIALTGTESVSFSAPAHFPVGGQARAVAVGDLNGDDTLDLAVAVGSASVVAVLLGTGDGSFGPAANFAVGSNPMSVAMADLNGDGKPDLAVANQGNARVSILLGIGDGSFTPATNFVVESSPYSVAIGDLNHDGAPDLAVACHGGNGNAAVLLGNGAGGFGAAMNFPVGQSPRSVAIGDLDGDGTPDLATANAFSSSASILLGTGTGTFQSATHFPVGTSSLPFLSFPTSVALADVNGDGRLDLAVTNQNIFKVSILLSEGMGTFGPARDFFSGGGSSPSPQSVAIGDLNGDGKPDLAVALGCKSDVSVLLGDGAGAFGGPSQFPLGPTCGAAGFPFPVSVAIADFNDDGKPDLATANVVGNNASVLLNTTDFPDSAPADTTPPDLSAPPDLIAEATGGTGAVVNYAAAIASDAVSTPVITYSQASGSVFALGATTVTVTATDAAGNSATATFTVTVVDTTPPLVGVPANVLTDATSPLGAFVTYSASAQDGVDGAVAPVCSTASGTLFPIGTTTVTCTATDSSGNSSTAGFAVTVRSATEMASNLSGLAADAGLGSSANLLANVISQAANGNLRAACNNLGAFINQTKAQTGKKLTLETAGELIAAAQRVQAALACR